MPETTPMPSHEDIYEQIKKEVLKGISYTLTDFAASLRSGRSPASVADNLIALASGTHLCGDLPDVEIIQDVALPVQPVPKVAATNPVLRELYAAMAISDKINALNISGETPDAEAHQQFTAALKRLKQTLNRHVKDN